MKVTEQLASPAVPVELRVQVDEVKVPPGLLWKELVPVGVIGKPSPPASVTVTVQTVS